MPDLPEISREEFEALPLWEGLDMNDEAGTRYRGAYRERDWIVTVKEGSVGKYSSSEEVRVV